MIINSMTGYGSTEGKFRGVTYAVEIRTVNSRYFKARVKLPEMMAFLEDDIEKLLRKELSRGTVSYTLRFKEAGANVLFDINRTALQEYVDRLGKIASSTEVSCSVDLAGLLTLPGMLMPVLPDKNLAENIREKVLAITQEAMKRLKQMRAAEGTALAADLDGHCEVIRQKLEQIRNCNTAAVQDYQKKLEKRVNELLANTAIQLDEETVAREVAIFADRSDISEEIARLGSHLQQFAECSCEDGQAGRRLEFVCQEMLREANTIASKASDIEIVRCVIDMKCRIERIKEQVQNVE